MVRCLRLCSTLQIMAKEKVRVIQCRNSEELRTLKTVFPSWREGAPTGYPESVEKCFENPGPVNIKQTYLFFASKKLETRPSDYWAIPPTTRSRQRIKNNVTPNLFSNRSCCYYRNLMKKSLMPKYLSFFFPTVINSMVSRHLS